MFHRRELKGWWLLVKEVTSFVRATCRWLLAILAYGNSVMTRSEQKRSQQESDLNRDLDPLSLRRHDPDQVQRVLLSTSYKVRPEQTINI